MTAATTPFSTNTAAPDRADLAQTRRDGRALLVALHSASRVLRLYPASHQAVQRALQDLTVVAETLRAHASELDIRVQGEFVFINGTRLRLDVSNYASFGSLLTAFRAWSLGALKLAHASSPRDWLVLLSSLTTPAKASTPEDAYEELLTRLRTAGILVFELEPPIEGGGDGIRADLEAAAKQTYTHSVSLTKDVIKSARLGRAPGLRRIKRVVQGIVDHVLNEETSLLGLTTLRDYDEYTYTHSVNVCIFSVALGKRLGMSRLQLYDLGVAALLHDIGKSRISAEVLKKTSDLDEQDWQQMSSHPWQGVLALFQLRGQQDLPYRAMTVAYEHHMKCDLSGYPRPMRERTLSIMSKIVAVADSYDAATSRRAYQETPWEPSAALKEMRDNPRRGLDPMIVKAFINLLGIYPPGTLVVLDSFELAVVRAANPNPELLSRPQIVVISDPLGNLIVPPVPVDLAIQRPDGHFARTIIKTADPERYGIRVSDYLL